jgi:anaerobic selenocysteine-containing dehydrogenase
VAYGRLGICQNPFGAVANWLVDVLNIVTGNFDRPGGAMFPTPAVDLARLGRSLIGNHYDRWRSRVRNLPEFGGQLPVATLRDEIATPGDEQVRALITIAGNPVLSAPNGQALAEVLPGLDFMVAIDFYVNETTRHAHIILPPVHSLERDHFDLVFHNLAVHNTVKYAEPAIPPAPDTMSDWEILYELGMRLGGLRFGMPLLDGLARRLWRRGIRFTPTRMLDLLLRIGPYGDRFLPFHPGLNLRKLRRAPHGIDLGPLEPMGKQRIRTPDGRVNLAPALLAADADRVDAWLSEHTSSPDLHADQPAQRNGTLLLIGRRHLRSNNSWMHNAPSLATGHDRATLLMHPVDARALALTDGALVEVRSRVGRIGARLEYSDDIMPGVVSLPHGFGHAAAADTLRVAGALPGPNVNAITDDELIEPLTGTAVLNGVPVTVTAATTAG